MTRPVPTHVRTAGRSYGDEAYYVAVWEHWRDIGLRRHLGAAGANEFANERMRDGEPACGWRQWFADNPPQVKRVVDKVDGSTRAGEGPHGDGLSEETPCSEVARISDHARATEVTV